MDDGTAVVLAASIPAAFALAGVVWQARKTRKLGTSEHVTGRELIEAVHSDIREIKSDMSDVKADVSDVKADVHGVKADVRTLGGRVVSLEEGAHQERKVILSAVEDHVDDLGEGA